MNAPSNEHDPRGGAVFWLLVAVIVALSVLGGMWLAHRGGAR